MPGLLFFYLTREKHGTPILSNNIFIHNMMSTEVARTTAVKDHPATRTCGIATNAKIIVRAISSDKIH